MKVNKTKQGDDKVLLRVSASADDVNKAFAIAEMEMAGSMGIAPQPDKKLGELIEERLGINNLDSVIAPNAQKALAPMAVDKSGIDPAFPPQPTFDTTIKRGTPIEFTMEVTPKPEYELKSYEPVEITLPKFTIDETEVDRQIAELADRNTTYETADPKPLEKGDACFVAIKCFEDGQELKGLTTEGRTYIAGEGFMPADFDEHILGMEPGETREFVFEGPSFDADYNEISKQFDCTVTLIEIQKPVVPELDDEWLKTNLPMYKSVDDLRKDIRNSIERREREQYDMYKRQLAVTGMVERFEGRIADEVYETARDSLMQNINMGLQQQGISWEDYANQNGGEQQLNMLLMLQVREMVVQGYVLDAVFRHEGLTLTDEDLDEACRAMAPNANPKQVREQIKNEGKEFVLRESAQRLKANQWLADNAKVTYVD